MAYANRVLTSSVWTSNDLASWDLSPEASRAFNAKTQLTFANTYYFSVSTYQTDVCWTILPVWGNDVWPLGSGYCPALTIDYDECATSSVEFIMQATGNLIGNLDGYKDSQGNYFTNPNTCSYDNTWEKNDGLVAVRSSMSPQNGITNYVAPQTWPSNDVFTPATGVWYNRWIQRDHTQIIGFDLGIPGAPYTDATGGIYTNIQNVLNLVKMSGSG